MIDQARLEAVLAARLPAFERLRSCERLSAGASRETYRIGACVGGMERVFALRRSGGDGASALGEGPGLESEANLFAAARAAGVPGPEVRLILAPEDGLGAGFLMDWVEGETLGGRIARGDAFAAIRPSLAGQCGEALAHLHAIDVNRAGLDGRLQRLTPEAAVRRSLSAYIAMNTPQPMIDFTAKWLLANLPAPRPLSLTHGDFRNGNLIVDRERGVVAVLDWELAHIGDPMRDLGWLLTRSWRFGGAGEVGGFGEREVLYAAYEAAGGALDRDGVRFWEVFGSFWWSVGCLSMAQSFREGSDTSPERPVIGRRSSECQIDCVNTLIPGPAHIPASGLTPDADLPRTDELLSGVRDFLLVEAASAMTGRNGFLARVGAKAIDIAVRGLQMGAVAERHEQGLLRGLLGVDGGAWELRDRLCRAIRAGEIDMASPELHQYLRDSVLARVLIDQPDYAGARECLARAKP